MKELFPIMAFYGERIKKIKTDYIPYCVISGHEKQAMHNHDQSLKRLSERGGLSYCEALAILEDREYSNVEQDIAKAEVFNIVNNFIEPKDSNESFNKNQGKLLEDLNKIICNTKDNYLWRELSDYDLRLRDYFNNINKSREGEI